MADKRTKASWSLAVVTGLAFLAAGGAKLAGVEALEEAIHGTLGVPLWAIPLIGAYEVAAAILLVVPRTRVIGAAMLVVDMLTAFSLHLLRGDWAGAPPTAVLGAMAATVLWLHRDGLTGVVQRFRPAAAS